LASNNSSARHTFLALLFSLLVAGGFSVFMMVITGGFFLYLLLVVAAVTALGYLNYLLWGRQLSREALKQEEEASATDGLEEWPYPEWQDPRRF
jgi:hypothetical protein